MDLKKTLYVFTSCFPCDELGEIYLWDELPYLADAFDSVYFLPQSGTAAIKPLPKNCFVIPAPVIKKNSITISIFFLALTWVFSDLCKLLKKKLFLKLFVYNYSLMKQLIIKANYYSKIIKDNHSGDIFLYAYWFSDFATITALIKKRLPSTKALSRAHGFDIFEDQTAYNFISFRNLQFKYLDSVLSVSKTGAEHLKSKNVLFESKIKYEYLGIHSQFEIPIISGERFEIVTCSFISKNKRIELMFEILKNISFDLTWHHIGDGEGFEEIIELAKKLPVNIKTVFHGRMKNNEIMEFYRNKKINLFVSLSYSEGLPVSMMEALSFGIPIMSTDTGGCKEICNDDTGFLIEKEFDPLEVAKKIVEFKKSNKNTDRFHLQCRSYWQKNFNAQHNYTKFSQHVINLFKGH
jgi:glycosyltransferase involved in cell wall biosynthesis